MREFSPFHVASFSSAKGEYAVLCKDIQTHGIDTLLVDNNEVLLLLF